MIGDIQLDEMNILDDEYYKIFTLSNLILNDNYSPKKPLPHQLRENILFQYYIEYKKMNKEELMNTYNYHINNLKNKYKL